MTVFSSKSTGLHDLKKRKKEIEDQSEESSLRSDS